IKVRGEPGFPHTLGMTTAVHTREGTEMNKLIGDGISFKKIPLPQRSGIETDGACEYIVLVACIASP
ncbi:MAG: hypothetical protein U1A23_00285, partial [Candidatus Sungbacteria bacterium]|nr:hypothetical protein [Candidatus Sungbacteria bacterium]